MQLAGKQKTHSAFRSGGASRVSSVQFRRSHAQSCFDLSASSLGSHAMWRPVAVATVRNSELGSWAHTLKGRPWRPMRRSRSNVLFLRALASELAVAARAPQVALLRRTTRRAPHKALVLTAAVRADHGTVDVRAAGARVEQICQARLCLQRLSFGGMGPVAGGNDKRCERQQHEHETATRHRR